MDGEGDVCGRIYIYLHENIVLIKEKCNFD